MDQTTSEPTRAGTRAPSAYASAPAVATALTLALCSLVEAVARIDGSRVTTRFWLNALVFILLSFATTLPLALPGAITAAGLVCASSLVSLLAFHSLTLGGLAALLIVAFRIGAAGPAPLAIGLSAPFVLPALLAGRPLGDESSAVAVLAAGLTPIAVLVGVSRENRAHARREEARRAALAESLREYTVRGERARIARELHDIVAHHISMVSVQAETARLTTPGLPEAGARKLSAIGDTARAALTEMRRLLGVLREGDWPGEEGRGAQPLRPQPSLAQLNELLDEARGASGAGTRLVLRGRPAPLDPGVELAAFRIVQEALTNARRHAPGAAVDVELCYSAELLRIRVRDNGPGAVDRYQDTNDGRAANQGHGLTGMRERAHAVGGRFEAGPAPGGGFRIEAQLPAGLEEAA